MASEQWLLNDTSVASSAYFTAVTGGSYKLLNGTNTTVSRTTSGPTPYEGAGCYTSPNTNSLARFRDSSSVDITGAQYFVDLYFYVDSYPVAGANIFLTIDDPNVQYTAALVNANGSIGISSYDNFNGFVVQASTSASTVPLDAWFRVAIKSSSKGIQEVKMFKGSNINGTTADYTVSKDFTTYSPFSVNGPWQAIDLVTNLDNSITWIYADNIKFDNTAYPTRGTAHTASGTSTITATGTAAMSNARVGAGTGTGTATGTGAASRGQSVEGSASVTASGTAAMSSTQVIGASGTGTATGTAAGAVTALVTISGAGTATASATAGASSTQVFAGSATVTATGTADASIRPIVTVDGVGTITATGATTASKRQTLAATATATASATGNMIFITQITASATVTATATALALITTPGTLYGNAEKVAGLYGSSTKPTLTTRS